MEICWLASGETLKVLPLDDFAGRTVLDLKRFLAGEVGASRFRQRLLAATEPEELADDAILEAVSQRLCLVITGLRIPEADQIEQMIVAAGGNDLPTLQCFLKMGLSPDLGTRRGFTPLQLAARNGRLESVELLVDAHANVERCAFRGETALFLAAQRGCLNVVRYLCEFGMNKEKTNHQGVTPLSVAAWHGKLDVVRYLADVGANVDHAMDGGVTPLIAAAQLNHLYVVRHLVEFGADKEQASHMARRRCLPQLLRVT